MKKTLLLFSIFAAALTNAQPNFEWASQVTSPSNSYGCSIKVDAAGNQYTTGYFTGTADFDPGVGTYNLTSSSGGGLSDIFIVKLDVLGNFIWAKQMTGSISRGYSLDIDASGNVYTTGVFWGSIDFDPNAAAFTLSSAGGCDVFISKLDASGNFLWAKQVGGSSDDIGAGIAVDSNNDVYITGTYNGTADLDPGTGSYTFISTGGTDVFILKLNPSGNFVWAKTVGGSTADAGNSISIDINNNVLITGSFSGTGDFNPGPITYNLTSTGLTDIFVLKLDINGLFNWAIALGGTSNDISYSIKTDSNGDVYSTGSFQGTADFDPGVGTFNFSCAGWSDIFVSKLDASGAFVWAKQFAGSATNNGRCITIDALDNVYIIGDFWNSVDFDPNAGTNIVFSAGNMDIFVSKLDVSGNFVWAKALGGTSIELGYGVAVDNSDNVYTTGSFRGTADFDPDAGVFNLTSGGSADNIFVQKMNQICPPVSAYVSSKTNASCFGAFDGAITVNATGGSGFTYAWSPMGGPSNVATGLPAGLYDCVVTNSCGEYTILKKIEISQPQSATTISGPGGVGDNVDTEMWFDASKLTLANNTAVSSFTDRSGNSRNATQSGATNKPIFLTNQLNGLPVVNFDGSNDYLATGAVSDLNTDKQTWFIVTKANNGTHTGQIIGSGYTAGATTGSDHLWKTTINNTGKYASFIRNSAGTASQIVSNYDTQYHIISNVWDGNSDVHTMFTDGTLNGTVTGRNASPTGHLRVRLGANSGTTLTYWYNGRIAEAFVYSKTLNDAERIIVENYLSTKYNIPLTGLDIYAYQNTHSFDAAGIGMTNNKTKTSARGSIVEMSQASSLANGDFLMWAHNNASTISSTSDVPTAYSATNGKRMQRTWRAGKTNDVGTTTVTFYLSGIAAGSLSNLELLVDNDGVFTDATRITSGFTYDDGCKVATWTGVNLTDGQYFTIGSPNGTALLRTATIAETETELEIEKSITLFPNPNNGEFSLLVNELNSNMVVEVYNSVGQIVLRESITQDKTDINIHKEPNGIYFVKVIDDNITVTFKKIVKQ